MLPTHRLRSLSCLAPMRFLPAERPYQSAAITARTAEINESGLGLVLAIGLHLTWFGLMPNSDTQPSPTPPRPIMVEWINSAQPASKPPQVQPKPPVPTPAKAVNKTKAAAKPLKQPRLIAAANHESAASVAPEPIPELPPAESAPNPAITPSAPAPTSAPAETATASAPLSLPNLNADYLNNPAPTYPPASRQLGEQGKVLLRVLVNGGGGVDQVTLRKTSGYDRLDQAALETVKQWRFVPARRGEQAVSAWVVIPVSFSLEG
ncbi:energy transducer TonB [Methylomonas sp. LWB]|uniref:energy transducer TonB n=1 Tax=Methylomonas sp. LWB TaxID=1905845 RepID=UPI0008DB0575|nr:energy transducer TonB [Methylomonas sp. LWB]OHX36250.1 energy transducer TonB [Methylomonas sp. LWB]